MKSKTIASLLFFLVALAGCSGNEKKGPGNARVFTGTSKTMSRSRQPIDRYDTKEVYFILEKKINCITLQTSAEYLPYPFAKEKKIARTFFIFERLVDLSRYGRKNARVYTELGRNFSDRWGRQQKITICDSPRMPLQRIDEKSIYRLRVTTFTRGAFDFSITVFSDTPVRFFNTFKEAVTASSKVPSNKK